MPLEATFFIQLTSNLVSRLNLKKCVFLFARHLAVNGGNGGAKDVLILNYNSKKIQIYLVVHLFYNKLN